MCNNCNSIDDESHRLNVCPTWRNNNLCDTGRSVNFTDIYSNDLDVIRNVTVFIEKVWNTQNTNGKMRTEPID